MREEAESLVQPVDWGKVRPVIDQAMIELPEHDRTAILLRFFENRPFAEIGACLGLSENSARMRVERALDALHGLLGKRGLTSTAAGLGLALAGQAVSAVPAGLVSSIAGGALATTTTSGAILLFMSTTMMKVAGGVVIAGAIAGLVLQHRTAQNLRAEVDSLRAEAKSDARLRSDEERQLGSLKRENAELAELRSKVSDLTARLGRRSADAARAQTLSKAAVAPANEGRGTATSALHTAIWALNNGDPETLAHAIKIGSGPHAQLRDAFDQLPAAARSEFGTPEGLLASLMIGSSKQTTAIDVLGVDEDDADNVTVRAKFEASDGKISEGAYQLNRSGDGGWQWVVPPGMVKGFLSSLPAK